MAAPAVDEEWPTNVATIICTIINSILLILTITIYIQLWTKSYQTIQSQDQIVHPHSPRNSAKLKASNLSTQKSASDDETNPTLPNNTPTTPTTPIPTRSMIDKWILYQTITASTFLLLSNLITVLYTINSQSYICCARLMTYIQIVSIGIAKIMIHLIFIRRLHDTFQPSPALAYPKWVFYMFYLLMLIGTLAIIAAVVAMQLSQADKFLYIAAAAFGADFVISIVVLLLFIAKLHKVFMARKRYSVRDVTRAIELQPPDKQLMNTMTKLTVLSVVSALSSLFLFILFTIRAVQESGEENHEFHAYAIWKIVYTANVFFMLSAMINGMTLYLILAFAGEHYHKVCGWFHGCMLRCCENGLTNCLGKERKKWVEQSVEIHSRGSQIERFSPTDTETGNNSTGYKE